LKREGFDLRKDVLPAALNVWLTAEFAVITILILNTDAPIRFDVSLVCHVALAVLATEVPFTVVHQWLHRQNAAEHKMHHCCHTSSWCTNLIITPNDLIFEFSGPIIIIGLILGTDWCGLHDPFGVFVALLIQQGWYGMSHDSTWRNHHYYHHKFVNGGYTVYLPTWARDDKDEVRALVGLNKKSS
jgi:hypothetical protein